MLRSGTCMCVPCHVSASAVSPIVLRLSSSLFPRSRRTSCGTSRLTPRGMTTSRFRARGNDTFFSIQTHELGYLAGVEQRNSAAHAANDEAGPRGPNSSRDVAVPLGALLWPHRSCRKAGEASGVRCRRPACTGSPFPGAKHHGGRVPWWARPGFPFGFLGAGGRLPKARSGRVFYCAIHHHHGGHGPLAMCLDTCHTACRRGAPLPHQVSRQTFKNIPSQPSRLNVILFAFPEHSRIGKVPNVPCLSPCLSRGMSRGLRRAPVSDEAPR